MQVCWSGLVWCLLKVSLQPLRLTDFYKIHVVWWPWSYFSTSAHLPYFPHVETTRLSDCPAHPDVNSLHLQTTTGALRSLYLSRAEKQRMYSVIQRSSTTVSCARLIFSRSADRARRRSGLDFRLSESLLVWAQASDVLLCEEKPEGRLLKRAPCDCIINVVRGSGDTAPLCPCACCSEKHNAGQSYKTCRGCKAQWKLINQDLCCSYRRSIKKSNWFYFMFLKV